MPHGNSGPVSASTAGEKCGDFCGLKTRMNDEMSGFWCVCLNMSQLWIRFFLFSNENPRLVAWLLGWLNPGASHARMDGYTPSLLGTNTVQQIIGAGRGHRWCHFVRHGWYIGILNQRKDYEAWHGTHEFLRLCCHFWNAKFPLQGCLSSLLGRCSHLCESSLGWPRFLPGRCPDFRLGWGVVSSCWWHRSWGVQRLGQRLNGAQVGASSAIEWWGFGTLSIWGILGFVLYRSRCLCWRYRSDYDVTLAYYGYAIIEPS